MTGERLQCCLLTPGTRMYWPLPLNIGSANINPVSIIRQEKEVTQLGRKWRRTNCLRIAWNSLSMRAWGIHWTTANCAATDTEPCTDNLIPTCESKTPSAINWTKLSKMCPTVRTWMGHYLETASAVGLRTWRAQWKPQNATEERKEIKQRRPMLMRSKNLKNKLNYSLNTPIRILHVLF